MAGTRLIIGGHEISVVKAGTNNVVQIYKGSQHIWGWLRNLSNSTRIIYKTDWTATLRPSNATVGYWGEPNSWLGNTWSQSWIAYRGGWGTDRYLSGIGTEAGWPVNLTNLIQSFTANASTREGDNGQSSRTGYFGSSGTILSTVTSKAVGGVYPLITRMDFCPYAGSYKQYADYGVAVSRSNSSSKPDYLNYCQSNGSAGWNGATGYHVLSIGSRWKAKMTVVNGDKEETITQTFQPKSVDITSTGWSSGNKERETVSVDFRTALLALKLRPGSYTKKIELFTRVNPGTSSEYDSVGILLNGFNLYKHV